VAAPLADHDLFRATASSDERQKQAVALRPSSRRTRTTEAMVDPVEAYAAAYLGGSEAAGHRRCPGVPFPESTSSGSDQQKAR
jgi:hypothetical protein